MNTGGALDCFTTAVFALKPSIFVRGLRISGTKELLDSIIYMLLSCKMFPYASVKLMKFLSRFVHVVNSFSLFLLLPVEGSPSSNSLAPPINRIPPKLGETQPGPDEHRLQYAFSFWFSKRAPGRQQSPQNYEQVWSFGGNSICLFFCIVIFLCFLGQVS